MTTRSNLSPKAVGRRYVVELGAAMLVYVVAIILCTHWLNGHPTGSWRIVVALLPLIPIAGVFAAALRFMMHTDEMVRRLHLLALAIAAAVTAFLAITYGFLELVGFPRLSAWWVFVCVDVIWGLSFLALRFRLTGRWFEKCL